MDKYKAYCTVHGWQEVISQGEPTVCPVDNQPELKPNSATILQLGVKVNDGTATELSLDNYKTLRWFMKIW